jgi:antibiotic biosynthesis monooxygenase (ABM) superfamily enzyme
MTRSRRRLISQRRTLRLWLRSEQRLRWLEAMQPLAGEPEITVQSDLETWSNAPAGRSGTAPRYKMMLLTWIAIYPTVLAFSLLLQRVPYVFHPAVSTLVVTGLTVLLAHRRFCLWLRLVTRIRSSDKFPGGQLQWRERSRAGFRSARCAR